MVRSWTVLSTDYNSWIYYSRLCIFFGFSSVFECCRHPSSMTSAFWTRTSLMVRTAILHSAATICLKNSKVDCEIKRLWRIMQDVTHDCMYTHRYILLCIDVYRYHCLFIYNYVCMHTFVYFILCMYANVQGRNQEFKLGGAQVFGQGPPSPRFLCPPFSSLLLH